jgi:exosortase
MVAAPEPAAQQGLGREAWIKLLALGVVVIGVYWQELNKLVNQFLADPNYSHGFIIPLFSLYLLYNWRDELRRTDRRICLWGVVVVVAALVIRALAIVVIKNDWIAQLTLPLLIWGLVLWLAGPRMARLTFVPIFFLALAAPLPDRLYNMIALPLQNFAARMSTGMLRVFGAEIRSSASFMEVTSISGKVYDLQVAEACSGMRSLMAFVALGVAMAYIEQRPFWQRLIIMVAGIPIAVFVNVLRVAATSTMFLIDKKELGEDFMHTAMGMLLLLPALLLLFLLTRLLDSLVEEVEVDEEPLDEGASSESLDSSPDREHE